MKKLLDQYMIPNTWEVNSDIRPDVKSCLHRKKDQQPFKKMQNDLIKVPKLEQARPLNYINKFPLPKPVFTFEVSRQRS